MNFSTRSHFDIESLHSNEDDEVVVDKVVEWSPKKGEYLIMLTISTISLMVALDATILVPVLPDLATALNGSSTDAFWAGTSYLLTSAVFQPFIGALSDIFGRQQLLFLSVFLFFAGTMLCAFANDFTIMLSGRSVQGIGGGGIITMGQVIFSDIIPLRQRPKWFALVLGAWALGSVLGPLVGGLFVQHLNWRWVFYLNFPFCLAGFIMVPLFVKLNTTTQESLWAKIKRIDFVGGVLFIGGATSFLIGLSWAGIQYGWKDLHTVVPMGAGFGSVLLSMIYEAFVPKEPFLRPSLFYNASAVAAFYCAFAQGFLLFTGLYYIPFYFMSVRGISPVHAGLNLFPVTCLLLPGSIIVSILTTKLGRYRWAIWIGWVLVTAGCGLFWFLDQHTKTWVWALILAVFGVGNGMVLTSVNFGIQAISRTQDCGRAASMYSFMRTFGMSIGVAVGGTTFQNLMSMKLSNLHLPTEISHNSEAYIAVLKKMADTDPVKIGALEAYVQGFRAVFLVMSFVALTGLVVSLVIKKFSMDKLLESNFKLEGRKSIYKIDRRSVFIG